MAKTNPTNEAVSLADVCSDLSSEYSVNIHVLCRHGMPSIICRCRTSRLTRPPSAESAPVQITRSRTIPVSCCCVGTTARFVNGHDFQNVWGTIRGRQVMWCRGEVIVWVEFDCSVWFHYVANASTTVTTSHVYSETHWTKQSRFQADRIGEAVLAWWYTPWFLLRLRFCIKLIVVGVPYV